MITSGPSSWALRTPLSFWQVVYLFYWPATFLIFIGAARVYKFRLPLAESPLFLLQDLAIAAILGAVIAIQLCFRKNAPRPLSASIKPLFFFLPFFWISLFGLTVTGLLGLPVNAKLFLQIPSIIFVKSALSVDAVFDSVLKTAVIAVVAPVVGVVGAYFLEKKNASARSCAIRWWIVLFACIPAAVVSRFQFDLRARDTNAIYSITASTFALLTASDGKRALIAPDEFHTLIANTNSEPLRPILPELEQLRFDGTRYDVLLLVLETGVAGVMELEKPDDLWLPNLRRYAARSVQLRRHLTPGADSTKAIFGIVASRYPFPNYLNFTLIAPSSPFETFLTILENEGYRTGSFASIDGDYDRMDFFLEHHGVQEQADRKSLNLSLLKDPTFGSDKELIGHYLDWVKRDGTTPYAFILLPSNSHWPFFYPAGDALFQGDDGLSKYKNALQEQDRLVGDIYEGLEQQKRLDRTIIVFVPDHGSYFNLTGGFENDLSGISQYHVPVFIDHPKLRSPPTPVVVNFSTSHIDLGPTIVAMLSPTQLPSDVQGISLLGPIPSRRLVFFFGDLADGIVNASDGQKITQWNRHTDTFTQYDWVNNSRAKPVSHPTDRTDEERIKAFFNYQVPYLRKLGQIH